jgi:hypothetical protein
LRVDFFARKLVWQIRNCRGMNNGEIEWGNDNVGMKGRTKTSIRVQIIEYFSFVIPGNSHRVPANQIWGCDG